VGSVCCTACVEQVINGRGRACGVLAITHAATNRARVCAARFVVTCVSHQHDQHDAIISFIYIIIVIYC